MATDTPVQFGVFVPQGWRMDLAEIADHVEKYEAMTHVAKVADGAGFDSIWVYDHFHTVPEPVLETCFECWSITAGLVRDTQNVKVGQMVGCNGYRNPALYAKIASTVDVMSHGRLYAGIGAGWYEHEWRAYGYGFPETRDRMRMFREACEIIHKMWTEDYPKFDGEYYTIDGAINEPKGVQKPHPPLWIGGSGEQVTLKLVAKWGDACNIGGGPDVLTHKFEVLKKHCDNLGRNYDEIVRSTSVNVHLVEKDSDREKITEKARGSKSYAEYSEQTMVGTPDEIIERLRPLQEAGVNYFIVYIPRVAYEPEQVNWFAQEVISKFNVAHPASVS